MSVINQMLQDLELRRALPAQSGVISSYARPLPGELRPRIGKWLLGACATIAIGIISGVALSTWAPWNAVSEGVRVTTPATAMPSERESPMPARIDPLPAEPALERQARDEAPSSAAEIEQARLPEKLPASDSLPVRTASLSPTEVKKPRDESNASALGGAAIALARATTMPRQPPQTREPAALNEPALQPKPAGVPATSVEVRVSAAQRIENDYRRALNAINMGRTQEAHVLLKGILAEQATHDHARQVLIGLLIQEKRATEAQALAEERLARSADHPGFAMIVARIKFERADLSGALEVLQASAPHAAANAEYLGFMAAVLQRLSRHGEAIERYRAALALKPNAGVWLMGLGISSQALERHADAQDAFRRARESSDLNADLRAFVEQRLAQLN
jgi:MSHA biogenesis protein MshN